MIANDHPYFFIKTFLDSSNTYLLSSYVHTPDTLNDKRLLHKIQGKYFNEKYVNRLINSLYYNEELAFHSNFISTSGKIYHIPMIDFSLSHEHQIDEYLLYRLEQFIDKKILGRMQFFYSGNSFHAYSSYILTSEEWVKFMASLLLIDPAKRLFKIIDNRWIGHRIISGYAALRWTNNTGKYKNVPFNLSHDIR